MNTPIQNWPTTKPHLGSKQASLISSPAVARFCRSSHMPASALQTGTYAYNSKPHLGSRQASVISSPAVAEVCRSSHMLASECNTDINARVQHQTAPRQQAGNCNQLTSRRQTLPQQPHASKQMQYRHERTNTTASRTLVASRRL
jgi:hypothetical protein